MIFTQKHQVVMALAPDADQYAADPSTDVINMKLFGHCTFVLEEGAGGTGTVKIVAQACDNVAGDNPTAINFRYRVTAAAGGDTFGALTETTVAADGYTTVAGAQKQLVIEIDAAELPDGQPCVYLDLTEVVDDPCDAGILAILSEPRYAAETMPTAIA